jgi:hypothetical protein
VITEVTTSKTSPIKRTKVKANRKELKRQNIKSQSRYKKRTEVKANRKEIKRQNLEVTAKSKESKRQDIRNLKSESRIRESRGKDKIRELRKDHNTRITQFARTI